MTRNISPTARPSRRGFLGLLAGLVGAPLAGQAATRPCAAAPRGLDDERDAWLRQWARQPRLPIVESSDPLVAHLLTHARIGRPLALFYHGGSHPGRLRRFAPDFVFRHAGNPSIYVSGFCQQAEAPRILRLDRIELA